MAYRPPETNDDIDYVLSGIATHDFLHFLLDLLVGDSVPTSRLKKTLYLDIVYPMTDNKIVHTAFNMARGGDIDSKELQSLLKDYIMSEITLRNKENKQ